MVFTTVARRGSATETVPAPVLATYSRRFVPTATPVGPVPTGTYWIPPLTMSTRARELDPLRATYKEPLLTAEPVGTPLRGRVITTELLERSSTASSSLAGLLTIVKGPAETSAGAKIATRATAIERTAAPTLILPDVLAVTVT